jgi:hypothetical protein
LSIPEKSSLTGYKTPEGGSPQPTGTLQWTNPATPVQRRGFYSAWWFNYGKYQIDEFFLQIDDDTVCAATSY